MQEQKQSLGSVFTPAQLFVGGIISGVLVLCTIGFFIMLSVYFGGGTQTAVLGDRSGGAANPSVQQPAGAQPAAADLTVRKVDETDYIRGNAKAKVTIVEFSDFECPFCQQFHNTMKQIIDTYGDDVRWVYRHFPLTSIHPNAVAFANAAECAGEQNKFWEMADLIFENQTGGAAVSTLEGYARQIGLNVSKFTSCVNKQTYNSKVTADAQEAQRLGGRGTPYSVIVGPDGETIPLSGAQPYSAVEAAILPLLN